MVAITVGNKTVIKQKLYEVNLVNLWCNIHNLSTINFRDLKNLCIGLNTAYAIGAKNGGILLSLLIILSNKFIEDIENALTTEELIKI